MKKKKSAKENKKEKCSHFNGEVTPSRRKPLLKLWLIVSSVMTVLGFVVTTLGGFAPIKSLFTSQKEKYDEEAFVSGELKPERLMKRSGFVYTRTEKPMAFYLDTLGVNGPHIKGILAKNFRDPEFARNGWIVTRLGRYIFTCWAGDLHHGIEILNPIFGGCTASKIVLGIKDDRLYVSAEFKDIQKEETIGFIEFNHWKLYKENMLNFLNDDDKLEVRDKQNNIVLSLKYYGHQNGLMISGYFIDYNSVLVVRDTFEDFKDENQCISKQDSNWKNKAMREISLIRTVIKK